MTGRCLILRKLIEGEYRAQLPDCRILKVRARSSEGWMDEWMAI